MLDTVTKIIPVILFVAGAVYFLLRRDGAAKLLKENIITDSLQAKSDEGLKGLDIKSLMASSGLLNVDECEFVSAASENPDIQSLNETFSGEAILIGEMDGPCNLQSSGELSLPDKQAKLAREFRANKGLNEAHGLITRRDVMQDFDFRHLSYWQSDYADVQALRDCGAKPPIISSGGIVVCSEAGKILLHRRGPNAATYPHARHILGGSFKPKILDILNDNNDLDYTARREFNEETGNALGSKSFDLSTGLRVSSIELSSGFIQITHLGVDIRSDQLDQLSSTPEGSLDILSFDDLKQALHNGNWVPSGQMLLLYWLSKGGLTRDNTCAFSDSQACRNLYKEIISSPEKITKGWSGVLLPKRPL